MLSPSFFLLLDDGLLTLLFIGLFKTSLPGVGAAFELNISRAFLRKVHYSISFSFGFEADLQLRTASVEKVEFLQLQKTQLIFKSEILPPKF